MSSCQTTKTTAHTDSYQCTEFAWQRRGEGWSGPWRRRRTFVRRRETGDGRRSESAVVPCADLDGAPERAADSTAADWTAPRGKTGVLSGRCPAPAPAAGSTKPCASPAKRQVIAAPLKFWGGAPCPPRLCQRCSDLSMHNTRLLASRVCQIRHDYSVKGWYVFAILKDGSNHPCPARSFWGDEYNRLGGKDEKH